MQADDEPVHVFNAMGCSRVDCHVVLVRAPTWRDTQGEIPDEDNDENVVEIEDVGSLSCLKLDPIGDYPPPDYGGTWSGAGQQVNTAALEGENLTVTSIPYDDERLAAVVAEHQRTYQESERTGGTP